MTHKLGVVGVGLMGKEIALNLLESGFDVMAFDKIRPFWRNCGRRA